MGTDNEKRRHAPLKPSPRKEKKCESFRRTQDPIPRILLINSTFLNNVYSERFPLMVIIFITIHIYFLDAFGQARLPSPLFPPPSPSTPLLPLIHP
jgi:hypothetical protein